MAKLTKQDLIEIVSTYEELCEEQNKALAAQNKSLHDANESMQKLQKLYQETNHSAVAIQNANLKLVECLHKNIVVEPKMTIRMDTVCCSDTLGRW